MSRVAVVGAGVGGLACAVRLAHAGHDVCVLERSGAAGGKCGRRRRDGYVWDSGPSLLTMPWVFEELFADTGAPLHEELELLRIEPVTEYRFADGSRVELSADLPTAMRNLDAWSPGAGDDWMRFLGVCAEMWRASVPFLTGPPPWPPRRPEPGTPPPDPRDLLRVKPWLTLRGLARSVARDPRLRMIIERFATYAGADPRRAPAALAVAGFVEHAWGAWHPRGGMYAIVEALERRFGELGGTLRFHAPVTSIEPGSAVVLEDGERIRADVVVANADAESVMRDLLQRPPRKAHERSLSGFAVMFGLEEPDPRFPHHHTILFPRDYDAEFDDVFVRRRPVVDPTLYVCVAPEDRRAWFVLANAPTGISWPDPEAYAQRIAATLGIEPRVCEIRSPVDLERETGAVGGAIYGWAPHGRLGTLKRPPNIVRGAKGLYLVGGTTHPGGGLPLVVLSAATVAREIGSAPSHVPVAP